MKREEAISLLGWFKSKTNRDDDLEAIDMAIEALSEPTGDLISRADAIKTVHKYFVKEIDKTPHEIDEDGDDVYTDMPTVNSLLTCNKELSKALKALPSAEAKGDLISRQWLLDLYATPEDGDDVEWKVPLEVVRQNILDAPSADAVSREEYDQLEALYDAIRIYDSSAEAVQGWIPCSERLPDVDVEVLTTTDWSEVLIAWYRKDGTWETDEYILANDEILAWMPLPKPYKGGDSE